MLYKIARKLTTEYIDDLSFADRTGGMVRVMNDSRKGEKTYPIEVNQDKVLGDMQYLRRLVPDTDLKSLMYWEMGSSPSVVANHNMYYDVEAQLKLVCWFNYQRVDPDMYDPSYMVAEIIQAIPFSIGSFECLTAVTCAFAGEDENKGEIFSAYTYTEPESQFFKYPYDYFVLTFDISYRVVRTCFEEGLSSLPVDPVLIYMSRDDAKVVTVAGVSGREYQTYIYASDLTVITDRALHEYSGEDFDFSFTPKAGFDSLFRIDYGREYLRKIDVSNYDVFNITIPSDTNIRLEYIDLSDNDIVVAAYLNALILHCYNTDVNDGFMDISGGVNAAIVDIVTLAYITDMTTNRGWTITHN